MGLPEQAAQARSRAPGSFEVFDHNWPTVMLWCATWRQWLRAPDGQRIGLDWTQVESAARLSHQPRRLWPDIFNGLRIMQDAALDALSK